MNNLLKSAFVSALFLVACNSNTTGTQPGPSPVSGEKVEFAKVKAIITQRCTACHSANATIKTFGVPAAGVAFDTDAQIKAKADRIKDRAVVRKDMPQGNVTGMTEEERVLIGKWVDSGAPLQ